MRYGVLLFSATRPIRLDWSSKRLVLRPTIWNTARIDNMLERDRLKWEQTTELYANLWMCIVKERKLQTTTT